MKSKDAESTAAEGFGEVGSVDDAPVLNASQ